MRVMKLFPKRGAKLGQHFLTSPAIAARIARESGAAPGTTVLEVGPGKGILTKELLALGASVVAVEKDPAMVQMCTDTFAADIARGQLTLIEEDARHFLTSDLVARLPHGYRVAANIPYYITGELIRGFLTAPHQPVSVVLLVQKEVAERIARSNKESILSLSVKAYGTPTYISTVKAGNFNPPPAVDSAILKIDHISRDHFRTVSEQALFALLHAGFGQKRKVLLGNLKRAYGAQVAALWDTLDLDERVRAEDVPLETWLALAQRV